MQSIAEETRNGSIPMSISRPSALGGVARVQGGEHEVAGQRRLDGDVRGLAVADLADHDHVGVGAQHRAQADVEGDAGLRRDLHLLDAGDALLDGVLDREDAAFAVVERRSARAYSVVDLPEPVGPVTSTAPFGLSIAAVEAVQLVLLHARATRGPRRATPPSRIRITTPSP